MRIFEGFPKIPRLNREIIITEKIDGTNAQVVIVADDAVDASDPAYDACLRCVKRPDGSTVHVYAGSRNRILTPPADNFGFGHWVYDYAEHLVDILGEGRHFGEWYGKGIQREYGLTDKYFALFNVERWKWINEARHVRHIPVQLTTVPVLYRGKFDSREIDFMLWNLKAYGSRIPEAKGFAKPEGIMVYHSAANTSFKVTCENDQKAKSQ